MLLEALNALILAGEDALHTSCGLSVLNREISLLGQGSLTFPALAELQIRNGPLQKVHLGCDSLLVGHLAGMDSGDEGSTGIDTLTGRFLKQLLGELDARNPRGTVQHLDIGPMNLISRGRRSFGIRLETEAGQLFMLSEIPSRMEMETARGSEYLATMEASYLPRGWDTRNAIDSGLGIENLLVFLRKVEGDVVFEIPGEDGEGAVHSGLLLDNGTFDGERALKFCTDLCAETAPEPGAVIRATVGIGDRSLQFGMTYLGAGSQALVNGAELSAAFFLPPERVTVAQQRLAFRIPLHHDIAVELLADEEGVSPWGDHDQQKGPLFAGELADISFSGARLVAEEKPGMRCIDLNRQVSCRIHLPDKDEPLTVLALVRRSTARLVDRNTRRFEIGLEFLISQDTDRAALDSIREFVLAEQRARLAQRIHLSGV